MEELRREFLRETVSKLEILLNKFSAEKSDSGAESLRRELFRRLHTIKGTAQTFGLSGSAALAHKMESLLQAAAERRADPNENFKLLILEGVGILAENLRRADLGQEEISPRAFLDRACDFLPDSFIAETDVNFALQSVPPELLAVLSGYETGALAAHIKRGDNFYLIAAFFRFAEFGEKFRELKNLLADRGEVVAAAPDPHPPADSIGFRFYFTGGISPDEIEKTIAPFDAKVVFPETAALSPGARGVLEQAARAGERAARSLGKTVDFEIEPAETALSPQQMRIFLETSVHLVRNAVDHALETPAERASAGKPARGKIHLSIAEQANRVILRVTDDGRGIDPEKIRAKAAARGLLAPGARAPENEILQLIFAHGFSTSETVTEISGRGVGLDAVKKAAEDAGGTVKITSEPGRGTTFEIHLPAEDTPRKRNV